MTLWMGWNPQLSFFIGLIGVIGILSIGNLRDGCFGFFALWTAITWGLGLKYVIEV